MGWLTPLLCPTGKYDRCKPYPLIKTLKSKSNTKTNLFGQFLLNIRNLQYECPSRLVNKKYTIQIDIICIYIYIFVYLFTYIRRKFRSQTSLTFPCLKEVSQNCFVFDVVKFKNWGSLAELLCFGWCQVQKLKKSRRIASFWMVSSSKIEEISQNSFVFNLADK